MTQTTNDLRNGSLQADGCEGQCEAHGNAASDTYYTTGDISCRPVPSSTHATDDLYRVKRYDKYDPSVRPVALPVIPENLPSELKALRQWVNWRYVWKDGSWKKVPFIPATVNWASVTNPATWGTSETALVAYAAGGYDGVGFVLTDGDPYAGVDFDDCLAPALRQFTNAAIPAYIRSLDSYVEVSPSGFGVRGIVRGQKTGGNCKRDGIEIYDHTRYVTLTGQVLEGTYYAY